MKSMPLVSPVVVVAALGLFPVPRAVGATAYRFALPPGFP